MYFVDLTSAYEADGEDFAIFDVWTHYLTEGDSMNMATYMADIADWKENLQGNEALDEALMSENIFLGNQDDRPHGSAEYVDVATSLVNSRDLTTQGTTEEHNPQYKVCFSQDAHGQGYGGKHPDTEAFLISYTNMLVNMLPVSDSTASKNSSPE